MRVVLDTCILISALITKGTPPQQLFLLWDRGIFDLITSQEQIAEFTRVVKYPKLQKFIHPSDVSKIKAYLKYKAVHVDKLPEIDLSPDPDDNLIIATAVAGEVDYLVSGDKKDLLALEKVYGIPIITARQAISIFSER